MALLHILTSFCVPMQMNKPKACTSNDVQVDTFVAVTSTRYTDWTCNCTETDNITIDWYIGTYSGTWKPWKGRVCGKTVTFTETIRMPGSP